MRERLHIYIYIYIILAAVELTTEGKCLPGQLALNMEIFFKISSRNSKTKSGV